MQQHEGENLSDIIETIWSNICGPISMKDICRVAQPSLMISNGSASLTHFLKSFLTARGFLHLLDFRQVSFDFRQSV